MSARDWPGSQVIVRTPATSANLGPGFDSLGLALTLYDTVEARLGSGLSIEVSGEGSGEVARGEQHLVVRAMRAYFAAAGAQPPGIALRCRNAVPHGYGLGSSASAIVAGLLAARALAGSAAPAPDLLALAARLEGHADNVAACLHGGLTIAWTAGGHATPAIRCARLEPLAGLVPVLCVPDAPLPTAAARAVLPAQVPHADAAANSARAALLVTALTADPGLLLDATEDYLHQRYRAAAAPETADLVGRLRAAGIPAVVSGAGPAVLALTLDTPQEAVAAPDTVESVAAGTSEHWRVIRLAVDRRGAVVARGGA
jgi:homoserine kinase